MCRTRSATITIADQRLPLVIGNTEVRVLHASAGGRSLRIRLRILVRHRIVHLRRGRATGLTLSFRLSHRARQRLRSGARAQLAVVPFSEQKVGSPGRLNLVRMTVRGSADEGIPPQLVRSVRTEEDECRERDDGGDGQCRE